MRWALGLILLVAGGAALGGCGVGGASDDSSSATVSTAVRSLPEIDSDTAEETGATRRVVDLIVTPHCDDKSRALDCEGGYRMLVKYRFREGKPQSMRCDPLPTGIQFQKDGTLSVAMRPDLGGEPEALCDDAGPGTMTIDAAAPMEDLSDAEPGRAESRMTDFTVSMRVAVEPSGAIRYVWTSREGAVCEGYVPMKAFARTPCRWKTATS